MSTLKQLKKAIECENMARPIKKKKTKKKAGPVTLSFTDGPALRFTDKPITR
jgi:hypothetical protein